jgi:hypothetical protein
MADPVEYEEDGVILLEGRCAGCGNIVRSKITEVDS